MNPSEILKSIKDKFFGEPVAAPVSPIAAADPVAVPTPVATAKVYKLADGTEISINQSGETPAVGETVMVNGITAPVGDYMLEDKSYLIVGEGGVIMEIKPAEPVAVDLTNVPAAVPIVAPVQASAFEMPKDVEGIAPLFAKFATGTDSERIANLELIAKALMEDRFGYKIAEQNANKAIIAYEEGLKNTELKLSKQEEAFKALFDLVEKIAQEPTGEPKTLTAQKLDKFKKLDDKEARLERFAEGIKLNRSTERQ
jgi:hypothetical protein